MSAHHRAADFFQLIILFILLTILLVATPFGLKLAASIGNYSGVGLKIKGVTGTLLEGVEIESLAWHGKKVGIELKDIDLEFKKIIYSKKGLNIDDLSASALNIYVKSSPSRKDKKHVVIPDIPIPINILADYVQLDTLRIIQDKKKLLFKIDDMEIQSLSIIDNLLFAEQAKAKPLIWDAPMDILVNKVSLDFDQPHEMSGSGSINYSHIQIGDFETHNMVVGGTLTDYQVEGEINWEERILGNSQITIKGVGNYHKATFTSASLVHSEGHFEAQGDIAWMDTFSWDFDVQGTDVRSRQFSSQWPALVDLDLDTKGEFNYAKKKWQLDIDLNEMDGKLDGYPITASGGISLKDSILTARQFLIKTDKNQIFVEGKITEPFDLKWDINAKKIGQLIPGFKGSVVGKGVATGSTIEPSGSGRLKIRGFSGAGLIIDQADINLQGGTQQSLLSGKGKAIIRNATFKDFKVASADIEFDGDERIAYQTKGAWLAGKGKALLKNLHYKGYKVDVADIEFNGSEQASLLAGKGKAKLKNLQFKDYQVVSVSIDFDGKEQKSLLAGKGTINLKQLSSKALKLASATLDFDGSQQFLKLKGKVQHLKIAGQSIDSAKLDAKGTLENHRITLQGTSKEGDLLLTGRGGGSGAGWKGKLDQVSVKNTVTGNWTLKKPVHINVTRDNFSGSEVCIANPKRGQLCADTQWSVNSGISSKGKLVSVPLSQFKPWLPQNISLPGTVNGTYTIKQKDKGWTGNAEFRLPDNFVTITTKKGKKEKLAYHNGIISLKFKGKKVTITTQLQIAKRGTLTTQSKVTLIQETGQHRIQGEAKFDVLELSWLQEYFPDIAKLRGKVSSKVRYKGLLSKPEYSGELRLDQGRFNIPDLGTQLSNITVLIKTTRPNQAIIKGSLNTGGGLLNLNGALKINKLNDWLAEISLKGKNIRFVNTHEVQAFASPNIHLKISPGLAKINGNIHIPRARIRISELPETAIYESDDIVFVGDKKQDGEEKPLRILPNMSITLGNAISFEGFGLNAKLKGKFHVSHNRNNILSRGTLKIIDGEYRAYGQRLTIEHGVLVFNGPMVNPGLDIRATRMIREFDSLDDIKVGINLAGTLRKPKSSIFSEPPRSESDALSYLVTGQSLSNTSGDQAQLLIQAVRTLGINSGSTMLNRISGAIGLDDLNIITYSDYRKNKLQLGKKLGTNLYIRYITGLFDSFHKIAVDYKLGSKWSLQAESGKAQGIDFIYNIDTN